MQIVEIIYQNFDTFENAIEVEFLDEDENEFSDKIDYDHFVEFGYADEGYEILEFNEDTEWEEFMDQNEIDVNLLLKFLNDYYISYPDRLPIDN